MGQPRLSAYASLKQVRFMIVQIHVFSVAISATRRLHAWQVLCTHLAGRAGGPGIGDSGVEDQCKAAGVLDKGHSQRGSTWCKCFDV